MNPVLLIPAEALMLLGVALYPESRCKREAERALQGLADVRTSAPN